MVNSGQRHKQNSIHWLEHCLSSCHRIHMRKFLANVSEEAIWVSYENDCTWVPKFQNSKSKNWKEIQKPQMISSCTPKAQHPFCIYYLVTVEFFSLGNLTILRDRMTSLIRAGMADRVVIGCYATGRQPIRYHWTMNGAPIISSAARVIHNVLVLEPKTANDYGTYVCNVTNENGTDSYPIKLMQLETCKGPNSTRG